MRLKPPRVMMITLGGVCVVTGGLALFGFSEPIHPTSGAAMYIAAGGALVMLGVE